MISPVANIIIIIAIVLIVGLDILYIYKNRKKGKCIGCPYSDGKCTHCAEGKEKRSTEDSANV